MLLWGVVVRRGGLWCRPRTTPPTPPANIPRPSNQPTANARNPTQTHTADAQSDPSLEQHKRGLIVAAASTLKECQMAVFDDRSGALYVTDLGRVASHYYIRHRSMEMFNANLKVVGVVVVVVSVRARVWAFFWGGGHNQQLQPPRRAARHITPPPTHNNTNNNNHNHNQQTP